MNAYAARLAELNKCDKTVLESIDRPIRPLVIELNRLGLKTRFSCCGFSYANEEEPKSHAIHPFVVFYIAPQLWAIKNFFELAKRAFSLGWKLLPYGTNEEFGSWHLMYEGNSASKFYGTSEEKPGIHDFEVDLIMIARLTDTLASIPAPDRTLVIEDGNKNLCYKQLGGEWQVKPKDDYVVSTMVLNGQLDIFEEKK